MMSFKYGEHSSDRIGTYILPLSNLDLMEYIKKDKNKRFFENIERIIVDDYDESTEEVYLEIWGENIIDLLFKKHRYNVFYIKTKPNKNWLCKNK